DRVYIGDRVLTPTINPDESISVVIPASMPGGYHAVVVRRPDGTESNSLNVGVKPRLATVPSALAPGAQATLSGAAFLVGASVRLDGQAVPATVHGPTSLSFTVPGTGGSGSAGGSVTVQVRNPDGRVSNPRTAAKPRILEI